MSEPTLIRIVGLRVDQWLLAIARACLDNGVRCEVWIAKDPNEGKDLDQDDNYNRIREGGELTVTPVAWGQAPTEPATACVVYSRGSYGPAARAELLAQCGQAKRKLVVHRADIPAPYVMAKRLIREFRTPFFRRFDEIWVEDMPAWRWLAAALGKPFRIFGIFPHTRCVCSSLETARLTAPLAPDPVHLFNFAGTGNPARQPITDWLEARGRELKPGLWSFRLADAEATAIWFNDVRENGRPRPYDEYIRMLDQSWFTLCLPGYTGTTHRVLEAILRGSIPVLPAETAVLYDLPLRHGENCFLVPPGEWPKSLLELAAIPPPSLRKMRAAVDSLRAGDAAPATIYRKLLARVLGAQNTSS